MIGKMIYSKIGRNFSSQLSRSAALRPNVVISSHNHVDRSSTSVFSSDSASYKVGFVRDYLSSVGAVKKHDQQYHQQQKFVSPSMRLRFDPLRADRRLFSSESDASKLQKDSNTGGQQVISQAKPKFINLRSGPVWGLIVGGTYVTLKQSGLAALANLSLFWHINQGMKEILADYVHQEMTRHFILVCLRLFLIIAAKDVFVSLI